MTTNPDSSQIFRCELYQNVRKPLLEASTLPSWCYTDPRFFQRETERIFKRCWHFVCREDEIANVGDYVTYSGAGGPAVIIRGVDRRIRAFYNACRHRGTRLVGESGNIKTIVCPYHSWVYGLNGNLLRAPGMGSSKNFENTDYNLMPIRLDTWAGFIFICYYEDTSSLRQFLGNMPEFFRNYQSEHLKVVKRFEFDVACNWKFLIENAVEAYHTGTVHKESLGRQNSIPIACQGNWDALFVYVENHTNLAVLPGTSTPLPTIPNLNEMQLRGTYFTDIYPCTQFVFANDCMWWLGIHPKQVDNTHVTLGACFPISTTKLPSFPEAVRHYYHRWQSATPEDNQIAELQQEGCATNPPGGRFHSEETLVYRFANWLLDQVLEEPTVR